MELAKLGRGQGFKDLIAFWGAVAQAWPYRDTPVCQLRGHSAFAPLLCWLSWWPEPPPESPSHLNSHCLWPPHHFSPHPPCLPCSTHLPCSQWPVKGGLPGVLVPAPSPTCSPPVSSQPLGWPWLSPECHFQSHPLSTPGLSSDPTHLPPGHLTSGTP